MALHITMISLISNVVCVVLYQKFFFTLRLVHDLPCEFNHSMYQKTVDVSDCLSS